MSKCLGHPLSRLTFIDLTLFFLLAPEVDNHSEVDVGDIQAELHLRCFARADLVVKLIVLAD